MQTLMLTPSCSLVLQFSQYFQLMFTVVEVSQRLLTALYLELISTMTATLTQM